MAASAQALTRAGGYVGARAPLPWLALSGAAVAVHAVFPFECPFRALTGWYCPVCGGTRAIESVVHLHFLTAARDNTAVLIFGMLIVANLVPGVSATRLGRQLTRLVQIESALVWVGLFVSWTVIRNLPTLAWLRPGR